MRTLRHSSPVVPYAAGQRMSLEVPSKTRSGADAVILGVASLLLAVALAAAGALFWPVEHARRLSPDGRFELVARARRFHSLIPAAPGSGSDKPGWLELVRRADGKSCGALPVPMVRMIDEVQWEGAAASLTGDEGGEWDLAACTVTGR